MNLICCKCNYVLNLDIDLDDGMCPKCDGHVYQEGEAITDLVTERMVELMAQTHLKLRLLGKGPIDQN